jgi:hypothetical protein
VHERSQAALPCPARPPLCNWNWRFFMSASTHPTSSLIGYGFFFGWAVCFACSGVSAGPFKDNFPFPGNVSASDLLSKLLQIQFDIRDSLFQRFVFVWYMFVLI